MLSFASNILATCKNYMKTALLAMVISAILFFFFALFLYMGNYQIPNNIASVILKIASVMLITMITLKIIYIKTGWPKWLHKGELRKFTFSDFLNLVIAVTFLHSAFFSGQ